MNSIRFKTDLRCNHCITKIQPYLGGMKEVVSWVVDLDSEDHTLTVEGKEIGEEKIVNALKKEGYSAVRIS